MSHPEEKRRDTGEASKEVVTGEDVLRLEARHRRNVGIFSNIAKVVIQTVGGLFMAVLWGYFAVSSARTKLWLTLICTAFAVLAILMTVRIVRRAVADLERFRRRQV